MLVVETAPDQQTVVLIENKIDAPPQPQQAKRYRQRGDEGIQDGAWQAYLTCIIAPQRYLERIHNTHLYDAQISYEAIQKWLQTAGERSLYRANVIELAITQERRGYQPILDQATTDFWRAYWHHVNEKYAIFDMKEPIAVPANSDWPELRHPTLGKNKIVHKFRQKRVDLYLEGMGVHQEQLLDWNADLLDDDMEITGTENTAFVRINVPEIRWRESFDAQLTAVEIGLQAAVRLLEVYPRLRLV